jgi:hypothetical protein
MTFEQMREQYDSHEAMARDLFTLLRIQQAMTDVECARRRSCQAELDVYRNSIKKIATTGEPA